MIEYAYNLQKTFTEITLFDPLNYSGSSVLLLFQPDGSGNLRFREVKRFVQENAVLCIHYTCKLYGFPIPKFLH